MPQPELALIGNCAVASLVNPEVRHVWFCFPRLDGKPIFSTLANGTEPESGFTDVQMAADASINEEPDGLCKRFLHETQTCWCDWALALAIPFEWQDAVIRAATSLPETRDTARNWDYRHSWLRESYFTVNVLSQLGATHTMEYFVRIPMNAVVSQSAAEIGVLSAMNECYLDTLKFADERLLRSGFVLRYNDIDPGSGELWGNFQQPNSQVGTILSAHCLSRTWELGLWHAS